jgi:beta-glucosidase
MYIEPLIGKGYPVATLPLLEKTERYMQAGDDQRMRFDFDFWGIQTYTRMVVRKFGIIPYIHALPQPPRKRTNDLTAMDWEINPECIYHTLSYAGKLPGAPPLYVTENGIGLEDALTPQGTVEDPRRIQYFQDHLREVWRAQQDGIDVRGYYVWSFMDNFEWAEGYRPRFGLVHVDFENQQRVVKASGQWWKEWLGG